MDLQTLQFWHKLEHFYPYLLQEHKNPYIKTFRSEILHSFPCFEVPSVDIGKVVRGYHVYLGIFQVSPALAALEEGIGKKMRFRDCGNDESCFCMFQLSPEGSIQPESFKISSFPWAIHRVRDGKIKIDHWDDDFFSFQKNALLFLEEREAPVDLAFLKAFRDFLADQMNWAVDYCQDWLRIDMVMGRAPEGDGSITPIPVAEEEIEEIQAENESTDEQVKKNDLLNSFYIRDLERVIDSVTQDERNCGQPLRQFLKPNGDDRIDIESDSDSMFRLMSPKNLPMGRWPSDYGARLMQQVNVNAFLTRDPAFAQSFFSVNGPPGTGKTTLLKDVIAAIVTERAELLSTLDRPDDAFRKEEVSFIQVGTYRNRLWKLKPEFSAFGILVASNNNGAVENITHELPELANLPERYHGEAYRYFSGASDRLLGQDKTWGLNAAALGNRANRRKFAEAFWPLNKEKSPYNFRLELWELNQHFEIEDWNEAKKFYQEKRMAVEQEFSRLNEIYLCTERLRILRMELPALREQITALKRTLYTAQESLHRAEQDLRLRREEETALSAQIEDIRRIRPFIGVRLFLQLRDPVLEHYRVLFSRRDQLVCETLPNCLNVVSEVRRHVDQLGQEIKEKQYQLQNSQHKMKEYTATIEAFRVETGAPFCLDAYFENCGAGEEGKSSPWGYQRLNELREQLFLAALKLHEVFIFGSIKMKDNLDGFGKLLRGNTTEAKAKELFAPLLQSFFLFVPVVSTTFASVGTFLRHVPANEIGYLFIDEAGQAVPQSAVGAIWRARKVIAVGDPLQIEPVVTLHDSVIQALGTHFKQELLMMDKYTSVQTLGDRANRIGGWRTLSAPKDLWIGAPLTVHSRCQRAVFQIANRIAYNDKMIFASKEKPDAICRWIDIRGNSEWEHYVPAQAEAAKKIVVEAFTSYMEQCDSEKKYPSLFLITPFRSVKAGLVKYFRKNLCGLLEETGLSVDTKCIRAWISDCIGTIHTFQGKEADAVVLCLGVGSDSQTLGAVEWAGERPNILNVAVTRSKRDLYILGDQSIWCRKDYFKTAYDFCTSNE